MLKIINVISDSNIGGAGKCILTFLKYYDKSRFDVKVVVPTGSALKEELLSLGAYVIEADGIADKSLSAKGIRELKKIFKAHKPDVIHCHASMSARFAGRLYGKAKIVFTRHSVFEPSKRISRGIGKAINGFVNNATADKIIAVAEAAKDNIVATGVSAKKITVIKNGVEPLKYVSEEEKLRLKSNYNVNDGEYLIGIVARLNYVKGHIYILEALKKLVDDGIKVKLLIAGTGDYEEEIRSAIARLDIAENVIMAGFVTDVTGIMNILDLNINASFGTEATSLSLLEGMSIGLPAVVSDFGGNPGVVSHGVNGLIFKKCDSDDLYNKLHGLLTDDEEMARLKVGALKVFEEQFRAEVMTDSIQKIYEEVAVK